MYERPLVDGAALRGVDVDAEHVVAGLGEGDRERQTDVAEPDDADTCHGGGR